ncbi:MAG TPA: DUF4398 domain-containing protein [Woeseiaceae bacterium]|nr:DUF4398 domain-containing protein [Woeseiaceae bacterium]
MNTKVIARYSALLVAAATAAGCASSTAPSAPQIARAQTSIELAEQNGARQYATQSLDNARAKLQSAEMAAENGKGEQAMRLAEEAEIEARLAAAQSESAEAEASLREIQRGIDTLQQEINRKQ